MSVIECTTNIKNRLYSHNFFYLFNKSHVNDIVKFIIYLNDLFLVGVANASHNK